MGLSDQIKDSGIQLILDAVYFLKMLFHCSRIILRVGAQFPVFISEKLFRDFFAVTIEGLI